MTAIGAHNEIRDAVGRLCQDFPAEYWRKLDEKRSDDPADPNYDESCDDRNTKELLR